ncbi:DNA-binding protein Ets97D-like [Bradysia coprophila]|uniref:DNA-binding protein Ets97D-like n=1 Tax=Bradysia coprophila TaxID=38358 RepID=UPI00187DD8F4|nr:DNA-binding protein Ets97D-like [Bradysia coprophila]
MKNILPDNEIFSRDSLFLDEEDDPEDVPGDEDDDDEDDIIILHIDIREPIKRLKKLLEQKIAINLAKYEFWLQDAQILEPDKNLVDQCVKGEGLVQINVQVRTASKRINIVDVLKPTDDVLAELSEAATTVKPVPENKESPSSRIENLETSGDEATNDSHTNTSTTAQTVTESSATVPDKSDKSESVKWVIDNNFRKELIRLGFSEDPVEWTVAQVRHWLQWAVRQFSLTKIKLQDWCITGRKLCDLSLEEFQEKVPVDPGDTFWTHLELLRKCKMVAIRGEPDFENTTDENVTQLKKQQKPNGLKPVKAIKPLGIISQFGVEAGHQGNRTGNNGQIQLWQFLLEIVTDREHRTIISWLGGDLNSN